MSQNIIENKVAYLRATKDAIKDAIVEKGVEVKPEDTFRSYADKISALIVLPTKVTLKTLQTMVTLSYQMV